VFLGSLTPLLVPLPGIDPGLLLVDPERRAAHGRGPLYVGEASASPPAGAVPPASGSSRPFDLRLAIGVPSRLSALATGELVECAPSGPRDAPASRSTYVYETKSPVRSFAIAAGDYALAQSGDHELWYHPGHDFNRDTLLAAASEARAFCTQSFGAYPHRALRLVEVPSLLDSPPTYPMLVPLSETEGFLGNDQQSEPFADGTYFAAARGVARQWWGEILCPGASPGAPVLAGGLAEYAALALLDLQRGERASLVALELEEAAYLRERDPDRELALAALAPGDDAVARRKAALVLHMLERRIGRERVLAGLADLVQRFRPPAPGAAPRPGDGAHHATLDDLLAALRARHRGEDLEWFYDTWFRRVALPDMALVGTPELVREEHGWTVHFEAANLGSEPTAALPCEVELLAGRWRAPERDSLRPGEWQASPPLCLWLAPGETARGTLSAAFAPEAIAIDRRHGCLDFDRTNNVRALAPDAARASPDLAGP
jgi:hypothetical protein